VSLACCGLASQACRNCAVKSITDSRTCWSCQKSGKSAAEIVNCQELREACKMFEKDNRLDDHMVEKLKNMRNSVSESKAVEKEMVRKLLRKEGLAMKKIEEEEDKKEQRQEEAKRLCKDLLRKENELSEMREMEEKERAKLIGCIEIRKGKRKAKHRLSSKKVESKSKTQYFCQGDDLKCQVDPKGRKADDFNNIVSYGHRDGLGYSFGGRKTFLKFN